MTLSAGTPLGPYEIVSPLGAGGMGEVYRSDRKLDRDVAVKVLLQSFAADPDPLSRFEPRQRRSRRFLIRTSCRSSIPKRGKASPTHRIPFLSCERGASSNPPDSLARGEANRAGNVLRLIFLSPGSCDQGSPADAIESAAFAARAQAARVDALMLLHHFRGAARS